MTSSSASDGSRSAAGTDEVDESAVALSHIALASMSLFLTGASFIVVMIGANDEPYTRFDWADAIVQVGIGSLLMTAWLVVAVAVVIEVRHAESRTSGSACSRGSRSASSTCISLPLGTSPTWPNLVGEIGPCDCRDIEDPRFHEWQKDRDERV